jgi:predicted MFS family arabinose efflux permease
LASCCFFFFFSKGVTTGASPKIQADFGLTDVQLEFFVGLLNLCAIFGSLFSHFVSDRCGRRGAFLVAAVGFMAGILIMVSSTQYSMLMLGQMFVGLGVGFGLAVSINLHVNALILKPYGVNVLYRLFTMHHAHFIFLSPCFHFFCSLTPFI